MHWRFDKTVICQSEIQTKSFYEICGTKAQISSRSYLNCPYFKSKSDLSYAFYFVDDLDFIVIESHLQQSVNNHFKNIYIKNFPIKSRLVFVILSVFDCRSILNLKFQLTWIVKGSHFLIISSWEIKFKLGSSFNTNCCLIKVFSTLTHNVIK